MKERTRKILGNIGIVLDRTRHAANIGSVCRVMKNLGYSNLHLVNPTEFGHLAAIRMLRGSEDILDRASIDRSINDAISGYNRTFATSHRMRHEEALSLNDAAAAIVSLAEENRVALLFGSEKYGLASDDTAKADHVVRLPVEDRFPSLNLAQAVAVMAMQVRLAAEAMDGDKGRTGSAHTSQKLHLDKRENERLIDEFVTLAESAGFGMPAIDDKVRSIFTRANLDQSEYNLMLGITKMLKKKIFGGETGSKY